MTVQLWSPPAPAARGRRVATSPTRVFGLERQRLEALLSTEPLIVYRVMRAIVRAVHEIQRRISMHATELTNYIYKQHGKY